MDSIQEAFLMLGVSKVADLPLFQRYALICHAINLKHGFICTGYQEDDPLSTNSNYYIGEIV